MNTICHYCGKEFDAIKETALYCSNSHRTLANKQRRKDELAHAEIEKQRILELERCKQIADVKQQKREQKAESERQEQEKQNEIVRLSEENKRIQDEIDAAVLAEENRKDEEDRQKLLEKQEADEKQQLADKLRKSIADRQKFDKDLRDTKRQVKLIGNLLVKSFNNLSKHNIRSQNSSTKPDSLRNQGSFPQSGNAFPPLNLNSHNTDLKPINLPGLGGQIGSCTTNKTGMTSQIKEIIRTPFKNEPGHKSITGDFLDMVDNIF
jgi:hypothetical protein